MDATEAARNALECVLEAKNGESITIFCDDTKAEVGKAFKKGALELGLNTNLVLLETGKGFRKEIPREVARFVVDQKTQIYVNLLSGIREETPFRIKLIHRETSDHKTRLGHCPGVTLDMLTEGALALSVLEHRRMQTFAQSLIKRLEKCVKIEIANPAGTSLSLSVEGRSFFTDVMLDWVLMQWMNLPTGEVIVAPIEASLEGLLVCDLAVGGIGPVKSPVLVSVKGGVVQEVKCKDSEVIKRVKDSLNTDEMSKVVGEFAFGINPKARFVQEFLEAEKMLGTVHLAFGDNTDMPGGKNNSANHMDMMLSKPTIKATTCEGKVFPVMVDGVFQ
jgi:aminopeptidase